MFVISPAAAGLASINLVVIYYLMVEDLFGQPCGCNHYVIGELLALHHGRCCEVLVNLESLL